MNTPTPTPAAELSDAAVSLRALASVIRKHGTCAPMSLELIADRIAALTRELPAASLGEHQFSSTDFATMLVARCLDINAATAEYRLDGLVDQGKEAGDWLVTVTQLPAPAPSSTGEGDWPEDFAHENGNYSCRCVTCGNEFIGHKRRVVCRKCHTPKPEAGAVGADRVMQMACDMGCGTEDGNYHFTEEELQAFAAALARSEGVA